MGQLTFVLGGARSGKSTYAEQHAQKLGGDSVLYVATAEAKDDEMLDRVEKHQFSRPQTWRTIEAPTGVGAALRAGYQGEKAILVDCIAILTANLLLAVSGPEEDPFDAPSSDPFDAAIEATVDAEVETLIECAHDLDTRIFVVSNEVGMGIVPAYELGRAYRDILGRANQILARHADEVFLLVAGIPMQVK